MKKSAKNIKPGRLWPTAVAYPNSCLAYPNEILPHIDHSCWPTQNLLGPLTGLPIWKFLEPPLHCVFSTLAIPRTRI